jgi:hypothetical protein
MNVKLPKPVVTEATIKTATDDELEEELTYCESDSNLRRLIVKELKERGLD